MFHKEKRSNVQHWKLFHPTLGYRYNKKDCEIGYRPITNHEAARKRRRLEVSTWPPRPFMNVRPYIGCVAAAAYEAACFDHYENLRNGGH